MSFRSRFCAKGWDRSAAWRQNATARSRGTAQRKPAFLKAKLRKVFGTQDRSDALSVLRNIQAIIEPFELPTVVKRGNRRPKPIADSGHGGSSKTVSDQGTGEEVVAK